MLNFGYHYQYFPKDGLKKGVWNGIEVDPIPDWMTSFAAKLKEMGVMKFTPDSLLFNFYHKGGGIPPHIDHKASFIRPIYSFRLLAECEMLFGGNNHTKSVPKFRVLLPVGSLLSMDGYAANNITHSIQSVEKKTISITMRKVASPPKKGFPKAAKSQPTALNTISKYFTK
jgi:alkylated DNA repair dioxygenase AlkB